mgnify:CR=1 FL=1
MSQFQFPVPSSTSSVTCSSVTGCTACYDVTGCHYCSGGCHAYGSVHGCVYGDSCEVDEGCFRKEPQDIPVEGPTFGDLLGMLFVTVLVFTCAAVTVWASSLFKDAVSEVKSERDDSYIKLDRINEEGKRSDDLDERDVESTDWIIPKKRRVVTPTKAKLIHLVCRCCCGFTVVITAVLVVIGLIYFPIAPSYNVCDERFDWNSLFATMETLSVQGDFNLVLSLKNPNRFAFGSSSLRIDFLYNNEVVGQSFDTNEVVLSAHSITDYLLKVSFRPTVSQALSMQRDYSNDKLYFNMKGVLEGYATPLGMKYSFTERIDDSIIRIGDKSDESLCKCKQEEAGEKTKVKGDQ